ncbi:MAG: cadherin-like beta sandwich domain-containing protein [Acidimicrobiales bacterium]|nr:cadherin-like beta sandwich domain-containing protein [Acidimicrobiales bacterium]
MRAIVAVLVGAAAVLGPLAAAMGASPELQIRDDPEAVELGDIADEAKTVVNSSIDDAAGGVVRYEFELSSPRSVEVVLRLLTANLDVFLEDAQGEVLGSGTELGRSDERLTLTLAAGSYVVRLESAGPVRYRLKLKVTEPVGEPVGTRTDPGTKTDPGTESDPGVPADLVEAWTSVLDVGASDDGAGYSRWAQFGSLTPVQFEVDGSSYDVILLAEIAGGLYLGLRRSLDTEFTLEIDGQQFVGSDSLVPAGLALRGTYWWPTNGVLSASLGSAADVSLSVGSDTLPERGAAPPGAWFSDVPDTHDGSTSFTLELNFDEADVEVTAGSMADALTVTGGSLGVVTEVSPAGKTWELTVTPDAAGDVTVSLNAPTDCVTAHAVCTADGRILRNTAQAVVQGTVDDDDPPASSADLSSLTVDGVSVAGFSAGVTEYQFGVDASVAQVTVSGVADEGAAVAYSGTDADRLTDGHQLGLSEGRNVVTVTVTAADGNTTKEYTVSINRGSEAPFGWSAGDDFDTLAAAGNKSADGLWSDGTTMWVSDDSYGNEKIFAYTLATKQRDPSKDIRVRQPGAFGDAHVRDIWSDGTTMWVANHFEAKLFAYTLAGGQRDPARDLNTDGAGGNEAPLGLWSDGTTMWVSDTHSKKIFAYTLADGQRDPGKDIDTDGTANTGPVGLWSDGTTMWVADSFDAKLYAFTLADGQRDPDRDFDTLSGHGHTLPWAIWSDGATMWVSGFLNDKIFAYNMPGNVDPGNADLSALTVDGVSVAGFSASIRWYQFGVDASVARVTVSGVADGAAAVAYSGTDADSVTDGHQVDLSEGRNNVRMTVTAADGRTRKGYTVSINRGSEAPYGWSAEDDFDTLAAADNRSVTGLWSDGTTMWVADDADGSERAYAYTLATKQRDPGKDIDLRKPSGDTHVRSIWSDGTTMWMGESHDAKLYAFTLADGQRDPGKDIDIGNQCPYGL